MAATNYSINFLNGSSTGPVTLPVGSYTFVSTNIPGYESGTIVPFTITPTTTAVAISIAANGTMQVTVKDDLGVNITSGVLQLSNQTGAARYGDTVSITDGIASFPNVPYTAGGISFYVAQNSSDANHDPISAPQPVTLTQQTSTVAVVNDRKSVTPTFTMADSNYSGITPVTGDLTVFG